MPPQSLSNVFGVCGFITSYVYHVLCLLQRSTHNTRDVSTVANQGLCLLLVHIPTSSLVLYTIAGFFTNSTIASRKYWLTTVPGCTYPDPSLGPYVRGSALTEVPTMFDYVLLQVRLDLFPHVPHVHRPRVLAARRPFAQGHPISSVVTELPNLTCTMCSEYVVEPAKSADYLGQNCVVPDVRHSSVLEFIKDFSLLSIPAPNTNFQIHPCPTK
jgi:hypothetical protein